jgi:hypothetical protein
MIGWIILGGIVLALFALAFAGAGRDRHRRDQDLDVVGQQAQGLRNDSSGTTFLL